MVTHSDLSLSHICGLVSKWTFTLPLCGSSWCLFAKRVIQIQEKDGVAPGKFHNYNLTRLPSLLQIKGAPECLINIASNSSLIFRREQSLLLQEVPTGTCGLTPSICHCSNHDAFIPGPDLGGEGLKGEPEIIFVKNLAFITSPKVARPATLMKSCSWLKRAIVSLTLCALKTFPRSC